MIPIANKYSDGKLKRTLEWELKVRETIMVEVVKEPRRFRVLGVIYGIVALD